MKQASFATYSLAEIFSQTKEKGVILLTDCGPGADVGHYSMHSGWTWPNFVEETAAESKLFDHDVVERVALHTSDVTVKGVNRSANLILARIKSGLYRIVGSNHGHPDGAFKRHEKKRAIRRMAQAESTARVSFTLESRAHLGADERAHLGA